MSFGRLGAMGRGFGRLGGGGKPFVAPLAINVAEVCIGDSIYDNNSDANATTTQGLLKGAVTWGQMLSNATGRNPDGWNVATSGESTTQIEARFTTDLTPLAPKVIHLDGGINDTQSAPLTTLAKYDSMITKARALGAYLIILPVLPRTGMDATQTTFMNTVNAGLLARAAADVLIVDTTSYDPATMSMDGTHPNALGGYYLGTQIAAKRRLLVTSGDILFTSNSAPTNFCTNGFFTGAGASGTLTNASGLVADSYELNGADLQGTTMTGSLVTNSPYGQKQGVAVAGSYAANFFCFIGIPFNYPQNTLVQNDYFEAFCQFDVVRSTGLRSVQLNASVFDATPTLTGNALAHGNNDNLILPASWSGVLRTNAQKVRSANAKFMNFSIAIDGGFGSSGTADILFYVSRLGIRKVT